MSSAHAKGASIVPSLSTVRENSRPTRSGRLSSADQLMPWSVLRQKAACSGLSPTEPLPHGRHSTTPSATLQPIPQKPITSSSPEGSTADHGLDMPPGLARESSTVRVALSAGGSERGLTTTTGPAGASGGMYGGRRMAAPLGREVLGCPAGSVEAPSAPHLLAARATSCAPSRTMLCMVTCGCIGVLVCYVRSRHPSL
jgi:hypothetical protein